jgi:hypothetical protein
MDSPTIFDRTTVGQVRRLVDNIISHAPELESRALKAMQLLLTRRVAPNDDGSFEVLGISGKPYTVDLSADSQVCTCPDQSHRAPEFKGSRWCGHALAVLIYTRLGRSRPNARVARIATFRRQVTRRPTRKAA